MEIDMYIYLKIIKCVKLECIDVFLKHLKYMQRVMRPHILGHGSILKFI